MKYVLLIDAGNTRMKVALVSLSQLKGSHVFEVEVFPNQILDRLPEWLKRQSVDVVAAYGVNVAGVSIAQMIEQFASPIPVTWLQSQDALLGMHNDYEVSSQLGVDRFMGLVGVHDLLQDHEVPAILASLGTATTVDCLYQHHFMGGTILPGLMMMQRSLAGGTAQLPLVQLTDNEIERLPKNTQQAILGGVLNAQVGAIIAQWYDVWHKTGISPVIYLTGGARQYVLPRLQSFLQNTSASVSQKTQIIESDSLVLEGLRAYCREQVRFV